MLTTGRALSALWLLPACIQAVTLDCAQIIDDDVKFNLEKLGGPKTVHKLEYQATPPTTLNTTFTLDICKPLVDKDAKKGEKCDTGSRVCAKRWFYREGQDPYLDSVTPIAGEFTGSHGSNRALDPKITRLKGHASNSDNKEGVLVELNGGENSKAIVEFLCNKEVTGNEGFDSKSVIDSSRYGAMQRRADDGDDKSPNLPDLDKGKNLNLLSYKDEDGTDVLRLRWETKYACESAKDSGSSDDKTRGWGFFTWFIIIVFMMVAAYIIFGSWLNYNRYGARGWDLIPHGDALRDIPYIVKDWTVNMGDRMKGQSNRGGYSAV